MKQTEVQTCERCGVVKSEWSENGGQGIRMENKTYCCEGCAENTGCECQ